MKTLKNKQLFEQAQKVIPGGVNSPVRAFKSVEADPIFIEKAKGPYLWDADDNKYIDYCLSWGPMILGHADRDVSEIARRYYFDSVYIRIPGGILFEVATASGPGLAADEPVASLGERLTLPPFLEGQRGEIEAKLKPFDLPKPKIL